MSLYTDRKNRLAALDNQIAELRQRDGSFATEETQLRTLLDGATLNSKMLDLAAARERLILIRAERQRLSEQIAAGFAERQPLFDELARAEGRITEAKHVVDLYKTPEHPKMRQVTLDEWQSRIRQAVNVLRSHGETVEPFDITLHIK